MTFIRRNVWQLGGDWADEVLWYARGVAAMKARALAKPTSWRFYAGMHGFSSARWQELGYLFATDQPPSQAQLSTFWRQCQHGSWYFLPWHRGYVLALEANIRAEVVALNGPDDWALPYWNYFAPNEAALPPAFASPDWPDGVGDNPLFVEQRYGPNGDGDVFVPTSLVNLNALADPDFTGVSSGGSPGFGGVDTGFSHSGPVHGGIETQPHDWVHGLVGGQDAQPPETDGAMADPRTAGLDPIFWLHHANIDRLWASWNADPAHLDPTQPTWLQGPASVGERAFCAPMPDGTTFTYTPGEMMNLEDLGYEYDDLTPAVAPVSPQDRLDRLGFEVPAERTAEEGVAVPEETNVELVGANDGRCRWWAPRAGPGSGSTLPHVKGWQTAWPRRPAVMRSEWLRPTGCSSISRTFAVSPTRPRSACISAWAMRRIRLSTPNGWPAASRRSASARRATSTMSTPGRA
jgi:tyrosinase